MLSAQLKAFNVPAYFNEFTYDLVISPSIHHSLCQELAKWLIDKEMIEHLFGPNHHIEVCNQITSLKYRLIFTGSRSMAL